ncbi:MAG: hypothetical protein GF383_09630 [Candidatus Lokiarchaeota archaeon]|nr:hypothetical protein [Candidatus Lokiarchaeota archaeon]MBD3340773.1 hypothetical protein [Candidatus Lokiarchaeota archaeon]
MDDPSSIVSTRHKGHPPDDYDPKRPRLGRRENEPHSDEINYLYDVLSTNFPDDRTMWDLHHYFSIAGFNIDAKFDISYFKDMHIPKRLSSYKAKKYNNRVPTMVVNILSKSTWRMDIGENVDYCRKLKVPLYVVFPSYHVANKFYKPPFLRAYMLQQSSEYQIVELRETTIDGDKTNREAIIDVSEYVPFRLGLQKRSSKHESGKSLYRMILLETDTFQILLTKAEAVEQKAEAAEQKAEAAEQRANKLKEDVKRLRDQLNE